jgi:hypothetical protein
MTRPAILWSMTGIAIAGFVAGSMLHPVAMPSHLPSFRGLPPLDSAKAAELAFERCSGASENTKHSCYEGELLPVAKARGPRAALAELQQLGTLDHEVLVTGHEYAHAIGIAAYDAHPDVKTTFPECSEKFQSGCYHGVIQAFFLRAGTDDSTAVRAICGPWTVAGVYGWLRFQCVHGLGHGLTMRFDHDLPAALLKCDLLLDRWDRDSCYGGAFMENIMNATQPPVAMAMEHMEGMGDSTRPKYKQIDRGDPAYPCSKLADRYQESCWTNQVSVLLYLSNSDVREAAKGCDRAPAKYVSWCFLGLGTDINGRVLRDGPAALALCDKASATGRPWCYAGVAKNRVEDNAKFESGMTFCRLVPSRDGKLRCYEAVGEEVASLSAVVTERERMCAAAEPGYPDACLYGARVRPTPPPGLVDPEW